MITLIFRMKIKNGKEAEAIEQMEKMAEAVEANEPGVLAYVFHRLRDDPMPPVPFESYVDDDAFQANMKTPHMAAFQASVRDAFDTSEIQVTRLERVAGVVRG